MLMKIEVTVCSCSKTEGTNSCLETKMPLSDNLSCCLSDVILSAGFRTRFNRRPNVLTLLNNMSNVVGRGLNVSSTSDQLC